MCSFRARSVVLSVVLIAAAISTAPAMATDYSFHVSCPNGSHVVVWHTGSIDPGREYLRVVTGTNNPGCSIGDYNDAQDRSLPKEDLSHEAGVVKGIPLLGPFVAHIFGW